MLESGDGFCRRGFLLVFNTGADHSRMQSHAGLEIMNTGEAPTCAICYGRKGIDEIFWLK